MTEREPLSIEEAELARSLRSLAQAEPGARIDAQVLAAARSALQQRRSPVRRPWIWSLGTAAAAVLAFGTLLRMQHSGLEPLQATLPAPPLEQMQEPQAVPETSPLAPVSDQPMPPGASDAESGPAALERIEVSGRREPRAPAPAAQPAAEPARAAAAAPAPAAAPATPPASPPAAAMPTPPVAPLALPPPPPPRSVPPATTRPAPQAFPQSGSTPAPAAHAEDSARPRLSQPAPEVRGRAQTSPPPKAATEASSKRLQGPPETAAREVVAETAEPSRDAAIRSSAGQARDDANRAQSKPLRELDAKLMRDPEQLFKHLRDLLAAGEDARARELLRAWHREFPDHAIPDDLRTLLE